jgi:NAD(P)-dependent dehydrogenase (short-subunit alcohol dehydrogenase family)
MTHALQGKSVLVVGRGTGIARAIAERARSEGAHVVVVGYRLEML